jgi:hypothetical protein
MELQVAIAEIDPKAEYLLNHSVGDSTQVILEWRGPGPEPTQQELDDAWQQYLSKQAVIDADNITRQAALDRLKAHADPNIQDLVKALRLDTAKIEAIG